jgi:hypothetical protein
MLGRVLVVQLIHKGGIRLLHPSRVTCNSPVEFKLITALRTIRRFTYRAPSIRLIPPPMLSARATTLKLRVPAQLKLDHGRLCADRGKLGEHFASGHPDGDVVQGPGSQQAVGTLTLWTTGTHGHLKILSSFGICI